MTTCMNPFNIFLSKSGYKKRRKIPNSKELRRANNCFDDFCLNTQLKIETTIFWRLFIRGFDHWLLFYSQFNSEGQMQFLKAHVHC